MFFYSTLVNAANSFSFNAEQVEKLSEEPQWLKLLHSRKNGITGQFESYIDDPNFFLAPNGKNNPKAELIATLSKLAFTNNKNDQSIPCRFPARYAWIKNNISVRGQKWPNSNCPEYQKWREELNAESINLVFASAYLNSPSSMFGHTLLRFDPKQGEGHSDWLSYALNFGASIDEQDNSILYAFKGLAGGYTGQFQVMKYFEKIQEYSFMENRDLWEYRLNLKADEIDRFLSHLWELKDIKFDYFFMYENCSFRLLELLEVARPSSHLIDNFFVTAIPSEIVQLVYEEGFVSSTHYRPSQLTTLKSQLSDIPENLYPLVLGLTNSIDTVNTTEFQELSLAQQNSIVSAAYQLVRYNSDKENGSDTSPKHRFRLLKQLNSYPLGSKQTVTIKPPTAPETGHKSRMTSVAVGYQNNNAYTELSYRQNYHDLLDNPAGYFKGAAINFLNADLRIYDDNRVRLQNLEILNITSLSPRNAFFQPISWQVSLGLGYQDYKRDKLSTYFNAGAGYSYSWFANSLSYGLFNLHLEHNDNFEYPLEPGVGISLGHFYYSKFGSSKLELDSKIFIDGSYLYSIGLSHNIALSQNHALRLSVKQRWNSTTNFSQAQLAYRFYF